TPLENIEVDLVDASNLDNFIGTAVTGADGTYRLIGLPAGAFKAVFSDIGFPLTYVPGWDGDKPGFDSAVPVQVAVGVENAGIDAALAVGGSISGIVTDPSGMEIFGCASATNVTSGFSGANSLGSPGAYRITALPAGDYKVPFGSCSFAGNHIAEWYDDKPDFDSADVVTVALGVDTPGIDAVLAIGGSISGTVTDAASGAGLSDIFVCAFVSSEFGNCAYTRPDGTYT